MEIEDAAIRALLDKQAITEVLYLYCRAVDRRDGELLRRVYHPDAEDFHGVYNGPIAGFFNATTRFDYVGRSHSVTNILIELDGDFAEVESHLTAIHRAETAEGVRNDFLRCRYVDRFERRDGVWAIARRVVVYDWGESRPAPETAWWDVEPGEYAFGLQGDQDPLYLERKSRAASS